MKKTNENNQIIEGIKSLSNHEKNVATNLHEPTFQGTNAWNYTKDCIDTGWVSSAGKWVSRFEDEVSKYTNARYAIAVTNGTVAFRLALHLVNVKAGDEVLVP